MSTTHTPMEKHSESGIVVSEAAIEELGTRLDWAHIADRLEELLKSGVSPEKLKEINDYFSENRTEALELASKLENETEAALFMEVEDGDLLICCLSPRSMLSVKQLNDDFSYQSNNRVIAERHRALNEAFAEFAEPVSSSYKQDIYRVNRDWLTRVEEELRANGTDGDMRSQIAQRCRDLISKKMNTAGTKVLQKVEAELEASQLLPGTKASEIYQYVTSPGAEYALTAGLAWADKPKEAADHDKTFVREAYAKASNSARTAQVRGESDIEIYSTQLLHQNLESIRKSREEVQSLGNKIQLTNGGILQIFTYERDSNGSERAVINRDVVREIRKKTLESSDTTMAQAIEKYIEEVSLIDYIMFRNAGEVAGTENILGTDETMTDIFSRLVKTGERLKTQEPLDENNLKTLVEGLKMDHIDRRFTSRNTFAKECLELSNCTYVGVDVLDVSVDLVLSYEVLAYDLEQALKQSEGEEKVGRIFASVGDAVTQKIRDFRTHTIEILEKVGFPQEQVLSFLGGDEMVLAFDTSHVDESVIDLVALEIQRSSGTRVVVVKKERDDSADNSNIINRAVHHITSMKEVEEGTNLAKQIEKKLRAHRIGRSTQDAEKIQTILGETGLDSYIVELVQGGGWVVRTENNRFAFDDAVERVTSIV